MTRRATALLTLASAAGLVASGAAIAPPASAAPELPAIVDCSGKDVAKPREIVLQCGDAGVAIERIRWTSWTANGARGVGTLVWNTCLPETCVAGIVQKYRVRLTLGGLASAPGERDVFSQLTVRFPVTGPADLETGTYTLDNPRS